jgi:hypothetical protein
MKIDEKIDLIFINGNEILLQIHTHTNILWENV